jgi:plastocyanin
MRDLLVGTVAAGLMLAPALAYSRAAADGSFIAADAPLAWRANGTSSTVVTIAPGGTVSFGYAGNNQVHYVEFDPANVDAPSCSGVRMTYQPPPVPWSGTCTFATKGVYKFRCPVHPNEMKGTVDVEVPPVVTPTATPTGSATPTATPAPGSTATPGPGTGPPATGTQPQATLKVKLAATQRGTRLRGAVTVDDAKSRLEVTVTARLAKGRARVRIGRWVKTSAPSGAVKFSVALDAKARRVLRRRRNLAVTVAIALTSPDGRKLTQTAPARMKAGLPVAYRGD